MNKIWSFGQADLHAKRYILVRDLVKDISFTLKHRPFQQAGNINKGNTKEFTVQQPILRSLTQALDELVAQPIVVGK